MLRTPQVHTTNQNKTTRIVDSGASSPPSSHMIKTNTLLKHARPIDAEIPLAKGDTSITAKSTGTFETPNCKLNNVLHVPDLAKNLLSVNAITERNGKIVFEENKV